METTFGGRSQLSFEGYEILSELIQESLDPDTVPELVRSALRKLEKLPWLDADGRGAVILQNSRNERVLVAAHGFGAREAVLCENVRRPECACGQVMQSGNGALLGCAFDGCPDAGTQAAKTYHYILPLRFRDRVVGAMPVFVRHKLHLTEAQDRFMGDIAHLLSLTLSRFLTEEIVALREMEQDDSNSEIIDKLGTAAEFRDEETGMHVLRMKEYAGAIAKVLGMPDDARERLITAAPMHDVGKIGITDRVLLKPGKLTPGEYETMKRHTWIGHNLLAGETPLMRTARDIALTHHERWDGTGYPRGLEGEEIPLVGRICAVADVFDALGSDRVYKPAWPIQACIAHIRGGSGTAFDPRVVRAFEEALPELLRIRELFRDDVIDPHQRLDLPPMPQIDSAFMAWSDELLVGIDAIDEHHRYLFNLANELHRTVAKQRGSREVGRMIRALQSYAEVHFREEERLMRQYGHARLANQRGQHQAFVERIEALWDDLKRSPLTIGREALRFLKGWMVHHVTVEDKCLRDVHMLAGLQRMLILMALEEGPITDRRVASMRDIYNRVGGCALRQDDLRGAIKDTMHFVQPAARYLATIADRLDAAHKPVLIEGARQWLEMRDVGEPGIRERLSATAKALGPAAPAPANIQKRS